ncbi:hypothetical protein CsSME_00022319 [Camellia sinensis var. sinensis]
MKLEDKDLAPATSPLVGFNSQLEWPIGKIILPVKAGSVVKQVPSTCRKDYFSGCLKFHQLTT